jgi:hypothetical protein
VSFQAAVLRIVIRLLAAAVMFALAMKVSRGADQIPPTAMTLACGGFDQATRDRTLHLDRID